MILGVNLPETWREWELNCNWLTAGKECGSILSSRLWGGALRDDTKKGCVADCTKTNLRKIAAITDKVW